MKREIWLEFNWVECVGFLIRFWFLPNSLFLVFLLGLTRLVFLEKLWVWVLTELIFAIILTELIKRSESLSPIVLFIIVEVRLSLSLLGGFFLERKRLILLFCVGKLGVIPLWFWVFRLFQGLDFRSMFSIMTVYKIIPLIMVCLLISNGLAAGVVCFNRLVIFYLFSGVVLLSNSLGVLVVFSTGWLLAAGVRRSLSIVVFFGFYLIILVGLLFSEREGGDLIMLLFYRGLPPLGSFFGKLFVLARRRRGWGLVFLPLFSGLIVIMGWVFFRVLSNKGMKLIFVLFLLLGVFVCCWSFAEALTF